MTTASLHRKVSETLVGRILAEIGERIHSLVLFGSVARGEETLESDVDILVIGDGSLDTKKIVYDISYDLELENEVFIQPLLFTVERFQSEARIRSWLFQDIEQQGIVLYDDGTYRRVCRDSSSNVPRVP